MCVIPEVGGSGWGGYGGDMGQVHVGDLHWAVGACLGAAMCLVTILGHTLCLQDVAVHRELQWCSKLDDDTNSMVVQAPQINHSRREKTLQFF